MRLGVVAYDYTQPMGGQGIHALALVGWLRAHGTHVTVLTSGPAAHQDDLHLEAPRRAGGELRFALAVARKIRRIVRQRRLDMVLYNGGPGGVLLLRAPGVPIAYVAHHTYMAQRAHLGDKPSYRLMQAAERRGYRKSCHIVCVSASTQADLVGGYGIPATCTSVVPPTMDLAPFFALAPPDGACLRGLLYIGRLHERKDVPMLLRAAARLQSAGQDFTLVVAGEGPDRARLEAQARDLGIAPRVRFAGRLDDAGMRAAMASAGILVLPSRFEGFGIVLAEAMAAGRIAIGTDVPGIRDALPRGHGLLVPAGDDAALARRIAELWADPAAQGRLGAALREHARQGLAVDVTARAIQASLEHALEACRAAR